MVAFALQDEIRYDCYDVPHLNRWMERVGIAKGDYKGVVRHYLAKLQAVAKAAGKTAVVWQEVSNKAPLPLAILCNSTMEGCFLMGVSDLQAFDHYGQGKSR